MSVVRYSSTLLCMFILMYAHHGLILHSEILFFLTILGNLQHAFATFIFVSQFIHVLQTTNQISIRFPKYF